MAPGGPSDRPRRPIGPAPPVGVGTGLSCAGGAALADVFLGTSWTELETGRDGLGAIVDARGTPSEVLAAVAATVRSGPSRLDGALATMAPSPRP